MGNQEIGVQIFPEIRFQERLQIRSPNIALGRMSRRPGQRMDGLIRVSRHFCSTGLRDLLAAGYLLPHLKELKVGQLWLLGC